jgi:hypothetical protein
MKRKYEYRKFNLTSVCKNNGRRRDEMKIESKDENNDYNLI